MSFLLGMIVGNALLGSNTHCEETNNSPHHFDQHTIIKFKNKREYESFCRAVEDKLEINFEEDVLYDKHECKKGVYVKFQIKDDVYEPSLYGSIVLDFYLRNKMKDKETEKLTNE